MPTASIRAFTLVELLVVIAVIAVLLALLTPALDRAIYESEVTVCGAQQRTIVNGLFQYAFNHNRSYPHRAAAHSTGAHYPPSYIYHPGGRFAPGDPAGSRATPVGGGFDYRRVIEAYIDYAKLFLDPMAGYVDLTPEGSPPEQNVLSSYFHYDGYQWYHGGTNPPKSSAMGSGMTKMGNRLIWEERLPNRRITHEFNLLVADGYHYNRDAIGGVATSGHNDRDGQFALDNRDDQTPGLGYAGWQGTYSHYNRLFTNGNPHGAMDLNYGFQDGSVRRISEVRWNDELYFNPNSDATRQRGHRLTATPFTNEGDQVGGAQNWILEGP